MVSVPGSEADSFSATRIACSPLELDELQRAEIEHHVVAARELLAQDVLELGHGCQVKLAREPSAHVMLAGGVELDRERGRLQR